MAKDRHKMLPAKSIVMCNYLISSLMRGLTRHKEQLSRLLRAVVTEGRVERGRVSAIVGLKPSAARQVTRLGLDQGLLRSTSPKGPLVIAFPAAVLESYFPRLFLDLPADE